jgi:hypothetical protein
VCRGKGGGGQRCQERGRDVEACMPGEEGCQLSHRLRPIAVVVKVQQL